MCFIPSYGFTLTGIFSFKNRLVDSVLVWKYTGQGKLVFWHILCSVLAYSLIKINLRNAVTVLIPR